jgi:cytosine/adenosine deaminase-related metal-dependent hydrolase
MHIHAAQSAGEVERILAAHGCGPLEHLRDTGMLASDVVVAHLTLATDADLDAMRETGARHAHCPTIYPRRGRYPRLDAILARGIPTGFGTDWMQNDPFEGMRNAMNAMRLLHGDPEALGCADAIWLHTMGAARAMGLDHEIGSLEPGKKADLVVVDIDRPHLPPALLRRPRGAGLLRARERRRGKRRRWPRRARGWAPRPARRAARPRGARPARPRVARPALRAGQPRRLRAGMRLLRVTARMR